jgi:GNAT superfamily N-acetyltransferase
VIEPHIRDGGVRDQRAVLHLFDEAVAWLVARGLSGQWGEQPFSTRRESRRMVRRTLADNEVRIAEHDGAVAGVVAVGAAPDYIDPAERPELYVVLLMSARRLVGNGIGARLLEVASGIAHDRRAETLRVDCWADSPALVGFYEGQGFRRNGRFELRGWRGQILAKPISSGAERLRPSVL